MTQASETKGSGPAVDGCLEACRRCEVLIDCVTSGAEPGGAFAAIGPHLRHCVDHFVCLFRGLGGGVVDYDARDREARLEVDPAYLRETLASIIDQLRELVPAFVGRRLQVRQAVSAGGAPILVDSNLERELVFLSGHTIHHLAIMRLLAGAQGVEVPKILDVAYSTEAHAKRLDAMSLPRTG